MLFGGGTMKLILPQGCFVFDTESGEILVLVAGGRPPAPGWLRHVAGNYPVWAIDRGADVCLKAEVKPEILFGDADSSSAEAWQWAKEASIPVERYHADKDYTDLQLALRGVAARQPKKNVLLTGGMGRRFDHAYSNIYSLMEAEGFGVKSIGLADEAETILFLRSGQSLHADFTQQPKVVSLLPLSPVCEQICSQGLHWPLCGATLRMDSPGGISNRLASGLHSVSVSIGSGCLGIYFCWEEEGL
jgi:thiamine pyrophosphokinase